MSRQDLLTSDKITLNGLSFYGYHGACQEENQLGQRFSVDLEVGLDLRAAGQSDALKDTVSYEHFVPLVEEISSQTTYKLIESLAQAIADGLFDLDSRIIWTKVRVHKPHAPIPTATGVASVEITRWREAN